VEVSEAWSTKLCSCCGALNDPGNSATSTVAISRVSRMLGDYPVTGAAPAVTSL
jgi:hypothetical protein